MIDHIEKWVTGFVGIFLALYKLYDWWKKKRERVKNEKQLKLCNEDTEKCEILIKSLTKAKEDFADRVYIFRAHDSGGKPTLGKPYYINVVDCSYRDEEKNKSKRYNNIDVDSSYRHMINELIDKNNVELYTSSMEEGLLKRIYLDEGVVYGKVYQLAITKTDFYFMSITWFEESLEDNEKSISENKLLAADLVANQIKTIYKKHHKL